MLECDCNLTAKSATIDSKELVLMNQKLHNARQLYLEGIRDGNAREAVTKYTGPRYT